MRKLPFAFLGLLVLAIIGCGHRQEQSGFLERIKGLFSKEDMTFSDEEYEAHYETKEAALEQVLGPLYEYVGHALIPFEVGGAVDMYYFPQKEGTALATMELIAPDGSGPKRSKIGTYELVAFTREPVSLEKDSPFSRIERRLCGVFTTLGNYSKETRMNPGETCEIPEEEGNGICLILDEYAAEQPFLINGEKHGLLLVVEIHRSEMEYAISQGGANLIQLLKTKGHYPYSDLDREPVI